MFSCYNLLLFASTVEHDFIIPYCKMLIILLYYTAISKEIILFVNHARGKETWAICIDLEEYYVVTLITKLFHVYINCTCFVC